jgi:hypothetical protein
VIGNSDCLGHILWTHWGEIKESPCTMLMSAHPSSQQSKGSKEPILVLEGWQFNKHTADACSLRSECSVQSFLTASTPALGPCTRHPVSSFPYPLEPTSAHISIQVSLSVLSHLLGSVTSAVPTSGLFKCLVWTPLVHWASPVHRKLLCEARLMF